MAASRRREMAETYFWMAKVSMQLGNKQEAVSAFMSSISNDKDHYGSNYHLAT